MKTFTKFSLLIISLLIEISEVSKAQLIDYKQYENDEGWYDFTVLIGTSNELKYVDFFETELSFFGIGENDELVIDTTFENQVTFKQAIKIMKLRELVL